MPIEYVLTPPAQAAVPVAGSNALFAVHRIYCVARNYADHAKEMGFDEREAPFFFAKPADAVLPVLPGQVGAMPYPGQTNNLHHEISWSRSAARAAISRWKMRPSTFTATRSGST